MISSLRLPICLAFALALGLMLTSGCARKVVLDPAAVGSRNDPAWVIRSAPASSPAPAPTPAPTTAISPAPSAPQAPPASLAPPAPAKP